MELERQIRKKYGGNHERVLVVGSLEDQLRVCLRVTSSDECLMTFQRPAEY